MMWRLSDLREWFQKKIEDRHYTWALEHMGELPYEPVIINAGAWVKVEAGQKAPKTGIYLFLCAGDNHLLYEIHELIQGISDLLDPFQGDMLHFDAWTTVKPLYYYYIPYCEDRRF